MTATPFLGCIADDFTGATDLANILVRGGLRTVQTIGVPDIAPAGDSADALVVALKSRTLPRDEAVRQTLDALKWLQAQGCQQIFFKYCSTFDSTDEGNIGPVLDALANALNVPFTIACPAFPENKRTLYQGHLFVGNVLLSDSSMATHPLTPMHDANLVNVLQRQTQKTVGLLPWQTVTAGPDALKAAATELREQGVAYAIADAIADDDLITLIKAFGDLPLLSGGSGIALGLPQALSDAGHVTLRSDAAVLPDIAGLSAVLSGSSSQATNAQVAAWTASRPAWRIDPLALAANRAEVIAQALAFADTHLAQQPVLIYATAQPEDVKKIQHALGVAQAGELVEGALAEIAQGLHQRGVRRFVVAGGETSGAVVQALAVRGLRIGMQIDPGVPWTTTIEAQPVALALKSGNFGGTDFFSKALALLEPN